MKELFADYGVHAIADGQFGSCGKGALACWLAHRSVEQIALFQCCVTNAGPNSGHTSYFEGEKIVLKQLPTFAVISHLLGKTVPVIFSAGAVLDEQILRDECKRYPNIPVYIHPCAGIVSLNDKYEERDNDSSIFHVAGTQSGTGACIARKVRRDPAAVYKYIGHDWMPLTEDYWVQFNKQRIFMEISQGFSLGINSWRFYPKVTSRECTFMQGLADARFPASSLVRSYLAFRTYPIRVGNIENYDSGDCYEDQYEMPWGSVERPPAEPERTTVTNRERRIFSWSWAQFYEAMRANDPTHVFINFMNYLGEESREKLIKELYAEKRNVDYLFGYGPKESDIILYHEPTSNND